VSSSPLTAVACWKNTSDYDESTELSVVVCSKAGEVKFYSSTSKGSIKEVASGIGHTDAAECVCVSPDGVTTATGGQDGSLVIWNTGPLLLNTTPESSSKKRKLETPVLPKLTLKGHSGTVTDVCYPKSSSASAFSASVDQTVRVWDLITGDPIRSWITNRAALSISLSNNGHSLCTSHEDGRVRIWDVRSGEDNKDEFGSLSKVGVSSRLVLRQTYASQSRCVPSCRWHPTNENLLASVSHDGSLKVFDQRSKTLPLQTVDYAGVKMICLDWTESGELATGGSDGVLRIHRLQL